MALGATGGGGLGGGLGGLIGGIVVAAGGAGKGGRRDLDKALQAWKNLETSDFDFSALSAPELQLIGQYFPEAYDAIMPEEFKQVERAPTYEDERRSLAMLQDLAERGETDIDRIQRMELEDAISGAQARGREDILRDLGRRGYGGGADALRARISGNQQASQLSAQLGRGAIADRAMRRMQAVGQYGQQAGETSQRDLQRETANQAAQNRYSELWANMQTDAARYGAAERGQAQQMNLARAREVGDINALNRYQTQLENIERANRLRGQEFSQEYARTAGLAGGYGARAQQKETERAQKAAAIYGIGKGVGSAGGTALGAGGYI